jgi:general secretion pathway protein C
MSARLSALLIWALVGASAVFWGLRLAARSPEAPPHTVVVGDAASGGGDLTRLFGVPPPVAVAAVAPPEVASRFRLTGVMAPKRPGSEGVALIAIDGKLPRAFRVGAAIDGDFVLQSVSLRSAAIGPVQGKAVVVLELPPLPPPATGSLPAPPLASPAMPVAPPTVPTPQAVPSRQAVPTPQAPMPSFVPQMPAGPAAVTPVNPATPLVPVNPPPVRTPATPGGSSNIPPSATQ